MGQLRNQLDDSEHQVEENTELHGQQNRQQNLDQESRYTDPQANDCESLIDVSDMGKCVFFIKVHKVLDCGFDQGKSDGDCIIGENEMGRNLWVQQLHRIAKHFVVEE